MDIIVNRIQLIFICLVKKRLAEIWTHDLLHYTLTLYHHHDFPFQSSAAEDQIPINEDLTYKLQCHLQSITSTLPEDLQTLLHTTTWNRVTLILLLDGQQQQQQKVWWRKRKCCVVEDFLWSQYNTIGLVLDWCAML